MLVFNPMVHNHTKWIARVVALLLPLVFLLPLLSQTVFAQSTTYTIRDGEETVIYTSNETNPADVLNEVGIVLGSEDTFTTNPGDGVSEIIVQRNQTITITYCGEVITANTYGESLETLLDRLGLTVSQGDLVVSLPLDTLTYDGMEVVVDHAVMVEQTYTQEVPFEVTYCYDPKLPKGEEKLLVSGKSGQVSITASVMYQNSVELTRTVLTQTEIEPVVNEIVLVGTGEEVGTNSNAVAIGNGVIVTADGEILTFSRSESFKTTAYTHTDAGCNTITATGTTVRVGTVAVDPTVVPYGTRMFIMASDGSYIYGIATAEDCGGGVQGNHIDLYMPTVDECWAYGVRTATVYFLN